MTPIQQIKAKIERQRNILKPHGGQGMVVTEILRDHYDDLLSFIESREKEESEFPIIKGWVARDKDGTLILGRACPYRITGSGVWMGFHQCMKIDNESFPDLKWEDEPIEVEIQIRPL